MLPEIPRPSLLPAIAVLSGLLLLVPSTEARPAERDGPWSFFAYGGKWSDNRFNEIIRGQTQMGRSYVWAVGLTRRIHDWRDSLQAEGEMNVAGHTGRQDHFEVNTAVSMRWHAFPWDGYVATTLAYGLGLSHAFARPPLEEEPRRRATRMLIFMPAELTFGPPSSRRSPWRLLLRIHHRSGAFGFFKDAGGSNFISLGLRYQLGACRSVAGEAETNDAASAARQPSLPAELGMAADPRRREQVGMPGGKGLY
jgi:hypothetical protein